MNENKERRRSWREIDQGKDRSAHNREERPGPGPGPAQARTNKAYKAELDRFFSAGEASHRIKTLMKEGSKGRPVSSEDSPERIKLVRKVRSAETFDAFVAAVEELRRQHGLPNDAEILTRVLEHPNQTVVREALDLLRGLATRLSLLQLKAVETRLKALEMSTEDPDTLASVDRLKEVL